MSEMVEQVARALCAYPFDLYDKIKDDPKETKDKIILLKQMDEWRCMAATAIAAMREPTYSMLDACGNYAVGKIIWQQMIGEALPASAEAEQRLLLIK